MDMRSFSLNHGLSMMPVGAPVVDRLREVEDRYRSLSRPLTLEEWQQRPVRSRYLDNVMRLAAALE